jgi:hypothetical protein
MHDPTPAGPARRTGPLALLLGLAALGGCASLYAETPYAEAALEAARLDATTLRVAGEVAATTSDARVQDYVLLRAAEETLAAGYGHFEVVERRDSSRVISTRTGGYHVVTDYNGKGDADDEVEYLPEETLTTRRPGATLIVRMLPGPKPPGASGEVYDAAEVLAFVGPRARAAGAPS